MISKFKTRMASIALVFVMVISVFAVGQIQAEAAGTVNVTVADVTYSYKDTKSIFDLISKYRKEMNCSTLSMDKNLMNDAFTRAVELSVYASVTRPNGSQYMGTYSQLIGYNVMSNSSLMYQWKSDENSLDGVNEVVCMKDSLVARGVDAKDIVLDGKGFRTLDTVVRAVKVYDIHSFVVISQRFHNERAIYLTEHLGLDVHDIYGYNAADATSSLSILTYIREYFARVKVFLDLLTDKEPSTYKKDKSDCYRN